MARQSETVLLNEWLNEFHRSDIQLKRVRLGLASNPEEAQLLKLGMKWADAVVFTGSEVLLIEAKLLPNASALGQLALYTKLFDVTPELSKWRTVHRRLIHLAARPDKDVKELAEELGMEMVVYSNPKVDNELRRRGVLPPANL